MVAGITAWGFRLLLCLLVAVTPATAFGQSVMGESRRQATRSELEKAAKSAENASMQAPDEKTRNKLRVDALSIRQRLENGDFIPGDRIKLFVEGDSALSDTFTVRGDRMLPLPNIPAISLHGVLDSELEPYLTNELLKYIKRVSLEATPLVRISLVGFPNSNFYTIPVDAAITDVIAAAGGWGPPTQVAYDKAVVRRSGKVFMNPKETAEAIRQAKTVGDMALRDGDELFVPDKASSTFNWQTALAVFGALSTIYFIARGGRGRVP